MQEKKELNKMGVLPIGRLLATMSLPAMLSMLILALYNIVDSIFVSRISEEALAAVTLAFPAQIIIIALAIGTAIGTNSLISRRLGSKDFDEADSAATHGLVLAICNWCILALFGIFAGRAFMMFFTDDKYLLENGTVYLRICCILSFFTFIQLSIEKILQATGNMLFPMISTLTGAVVNIVLDPIMIFGLFGFPRLEVAGAAIATITGQFCGMTVALLLFFGKKHQVKIKLRGFRFDKDILKKIYAVGFPAMLMQVMVSILVFAINGILIAFSKTAVAFLGIYFRVQSFIFMPVFGLCQGTMPILGYNYGARNKDRFMKTFWLAIKVGVFVMALGMALFMIFPREILSAFDANENMYKLGIPALRIICLCFIPAAFGIISSTMFQSIGKGKYSLFVSLLRQLILILPIAWLLAEYFGVGAVWWAFPIAETVALIFSTILFRKIYREEIKPMNINQY